MAEIDIHIGLKLYRTVVKRPLGSIHSDGLRALVKRKIEGWGQRPRTDIWKLKYKNCHGELCEVTDKFPDDTDGRWREFFAAVFYVDF